MYTKEQEDQECNGEKNLPICLSNLARDVTDKKKVFSKYFIQKGNTWETGSTAQQ